MTASEPTGYARLPFVGALAASIDAGRHVIASAGLVAFLDAPKWILLASLFGFLLTTTYHVARWLTFTISVDGALVRASHAFIVRTDRRIPVASIHDLHFEQSVVQRIFRVVTVRIETAGGSGSEAELAGLKRWQADALKDAIDAARGRAPVVDAAPGEDVVVALTFPDLVIAGIGAATLWVVLGALFSAWFFLDEMIPGFEDRVAPIGNALASFLSTASWATLALSIAVLAVAFVVIAAAVSIGRTCVRYWGFRATWNGSRLSRSCGLFTRRRQVLHASRIQRVLVSQSLVQRWLSCVAVELGTAAVGSRHDEDGGRSFVIPVMRAAAVRPLLDRVCPGAATIDDAFEPVSPACARRYVVRSAAALAVVSGLLTPWSLLWGGLVWLWFVRDLFRARRLARVGGWRLADGLAQFRTGAWSRTVATIPLKRLQGAMTVETPFDRRYGVVTVALAAAGGGNAASLRNVPIAAARAIIASALAATTPAPRRSAESEVARGAPEVISE